MKEERILVVDGNPLLYRADSVLDLTNSVGRRVSGVFGTLKILQLTIETIRPTHVFVCWDTPTKSLWRKHMYNGYKAHRKPKDEVDRLRKLELYRQIGETYEVLSRFPVRQFRMVGMEADDLAYWITKRMFRKELNFNNRQFVLVTLDKDWLQLVDDNVAVLLTHTNELVTKKDFMQFSRKRLDGVPLEEFVLSKCLQGDKGDGVPGIHGIGSKTAQRILQGHSIRFTRDTWTFLSHKDEKVARNIEVVKQGKLLMDLSCFPYTEDLDTYLRQKSLPNVDWSWVKQYFKENEFVQFLSKFNLWSETFKRLEV